MTLRKKRVICTFAYKHICAFAYKQLLAVDSTILYELFSTLYKYKVSVHLAAIPAIYDLGVRFSVSGLAFDFKEENFILKN